jgi:subtilisin-like proprotein convertase family protein
MPTIFSASLAQNLLSRPLSIVFTNQTFLSMFKKLLALLLLCASLSAAFGQSPWLPLPENGLPTGGERRIVPQKFRAARLDVAAMRALLAAAPERFGPAAATESSLPVLDLPMPDGSVAHFALEETPVMHPDLQSRYPDIRCYTGRGIEDPSAVLKCDLTPWGFHAVVRSPRHSPVFIDPYVHGDTEYYSVYFKKDYAPDKLNALWTCETPSPEGGAVELPTATPHAAGNAAALAEFQGDTKLRRYRLALACTGEYSTFHGGTKPLVLAAMNTSMNRVNGVYERDFAVTMQIIANNDLLIYLTAASDPYTNNNGSAMLSQNQTTCNNVIGSANYDIGHVFSTGGGGIAQLSSVCGSNKAQGVTGGSAPVGDPFDIDYVAHEIGHQFAGNHTFNNCGGSNSQASACEPGSGTTIMAYAGLCGTQNVENNSDDYFHAYNITEMGNFIYTGGGNTCPVKITTTNNNPTVSAGPDRIIPKSTPFALTAIGSDVDGDTLSYNWDQVNPGGASPPSATSTTGALFRSFPSTASPTRYFPRLSNLVPNTTYQWEKLPGVARTMTFRVVLRDNNWQAGCTAEDNVVLTVAGNAGPFVVSAPNTNVIWFVGSSQTVTWDVANTNLAPVSCANVRISLSTDGGYNYPIVLAESVPNNGSANIMVPNNLSNNCRVKVEAVDNVFFDISNVNFRIQTPPDPTFTLGLSTSTLPVCAGEEGVFSVNLTSIAGFTDPVEISLSGLPAGATATITPNPLTPTGTANVLLSGFTPAMAGTYTLTVKGISGVLSQSADLTLTVLPGAPGAASPIAPADGATGVNNPATLSWDAADFAENYLVEAATSPSFSMGSVVSSQTVGGTSASVPGLASLGVYYWRVRAINSCGQSDFSAPRAFQRSGENCVDFASTDVPVVIDEADLDTIESVLNVNLDKTITDLNVSMAVTHSYTGDLSAQLVSPSGIVRALFDRPGVPATQFGCANDDLSLVFDDQAAQSAAVLEDLCNDDSPSLSGTFQPIAPLADLNGLNAEGAWKLIVTDAFAEDGGALTAWSLSICYSEPSVAGNILVNQILTVPSNGSGTLTQDYLSAEASAAFSQVVFTVLSLPQHGSLLLNGSPLGVGGTFTQADINANLLIYSNNGDGTTTDVFYFDALDQNNQAWVHNQIFKFNIVQNDLAASATVTQGVLCRDQANGEITVTASGLDGNYTYSINGGPAQASPVFGGLAPGEYSIVVTGQYGFTTTVDLVMLSNPDAILAFTLVADDDLSVTASGGTGVLEYSINGTTFQPTGDFKDLPNGIYTVTVRDANGCTSTAQAIVAVNTMLATLEIAASVSCFNGEDGALVVNVGGGESPYTYTLVGSGASQPENVFIGLAAGEYEVLVLDNQGLSVTTNAVVLTNPTAIAVSAGATLNVVTVSASGGTGALAYSLNGSPFQASNVFSNLTNGVYQVTVRDANNCTQSATVTVEVPPLLLSAASTGTILCFGDVTGEIVASATGGVPPYAYKLNTGDFQASETFSGLSGGIYNVTVRDAAGVETNFTVTVSQPTQIAASASVSLNDVTITASGGTGTLEYSADGEAFQASNQFSNLANATYTFVVRDANGCTHTVSATVAVPPLGFSFFTQHLVCFGDTDGSITVTGTTLTASTAARSKRATCLTTFKAAVTPLPFGIRKATNSAAT